MNGLFGWFGTVTNYLLARNIAAWVGHALLGQAPPAVSTLHALLVLLAYSVVIGGAAFCLFFRRDIVGASAGEEPDRQPVPARQRFDRRTVFLYVFHLLPGGVSPGHHRKELTAPWKRPDRGKGPHSHRGGTARGTSVETAVSP